MFPVFVLFCLCLRRLIGVFGLETNKSYSVLEGDSVTLKTGAIEIHEDEDILWCFRNEKSLIAKIRRETKNFSIFDVPDGRFKDKLKLDNQTGSLTITNIRSEHAGEYKVKICGAKLSSKTFSVSVYAHLPVPVLIFNSSQCSSSQYNCSVVCSVVNVSAVSLSWYKGNSLLSSISVSDLSISLSLPLEVEYQDNNTYSCVINNTISNQTTHLDKNTLCQPCEALDRPSLLQDYIISVAAVSGFLLIAGVVGFFWTGKKCRKTNEEGVIYDNETVETHSEGITYADPTFKTQ